MPMDAVAQEFFRNAKRGRGPSKGRGLAVLFGFRCYGRTAPSALPAYQEVDSEIFSTTAPVCGASMM